MVAYGVITPEELAEIHDIGQKMDRARPSRYLAQELERQQKARDAAEKAAIKAQKKAEAEERRRERAELIAQRHATDIVYLGRGVSQWLDDRTTNVRKLEAAGLPVLATPADLAAAMDLDVPTLRWLAFHHEAPALLHYHHFTVPKRSGGTRQLSRPLTKMAAAQHWILRNILDQVPVHQAAHGFTRGRSTVSNAQPHLGQEMVINCDLEDFFPTITWPRVCGFFRKLGYSPCISTILAMLCTESPRRVVRYAGRKVFVATGPRSLPQGAPTSPALSNAICYRLDARLSGMATKRGWTYTRYADDMTFSASGEAAQSAGRLLARVRHVVAEESFAVNEAKTRVQRCCNRQSVTGIVVNEKPNLPRQHLRRLRAILHRAQTEGLEAQNREGHPNFEAWLVGHIAHVTMVHPEQGRALQAALDRVRGG